MGNNLKTDIDLINESAIDYIWKELFWNRVIDEATYYKGIREEVMNNGV